MKFSWNVKVDISDTDDEIEDAYYWFEIAQDKFFDALNNGGVQYRIITDESD